jgi:transcriptional regulator with XRE-family HTH domain
MKKINEFLISIRKKRSLTRKGLENLSGFKERTIGSYERGERTPSNDYILFLSLYFNIELKCFNDNGIYQEKSMPIHKLTIERYKYIYQYNDEQILELIKYEDKALYLKNLNHSGLNNDFIYFSIEISNKLLIKPSSLGFVIQDDRVIYKRQIINPIFFDIGLDTFFKNEKDDKFKDISEKYYLAVLNKRNNPDNIFIPLNQDKETNKEFHEVLELLNYAPKDFVSKLIIQLKKFKTEQESFFE